MPPRKSIHIPPSDDFQMGNINIFSKNYKSIYIEDLIVDGLPL